MTRQTKSQHATRDTVAKGGRVVAKNDEVRAIGRKIAKRDAELMKRLAR